MENTVPTEDSSKLSLLYPDKTPTSRLKPLTKNNLLISKSMTISTILFLIKKKLELKSTDSLFVFANRTLLQSNESVGELAGKYARGDGCLVIQYTEYSVFG